jgi:site-specific DNA-methyltransferase (adenine-specific)
MDTRQLILDSISRTGIAILPPMDVKRSMDILVKCGIHATTSILDPWYNKGVGGVLPEEQYDDFIRHLLTYSARLSDIIYLWGFPEVIGPYVRFAPDGFRMTAWLTWFYKNCPSVIRGWRSSQNACLQFTSETATLHPENFLSRQQELRFEEGNMRFVPGPTSVIEAPLIVGFVGKNERTGHPSQKPEAVFERIILMSTKSNDVVLDLMAGSSTTGSVARKHKRAAILCDSNEEYVAMMENRLNQKRIALDELGIGTVA